MTWILIVTALTMNGSFMIGVPMDKTACMTSAHQYNSGSFNQQDDNEVDVITYTSQCLNTKAQ
jgi:hypothetical protein